MAKPPRRTITVNLPITSPVLLAAEQRAAAERRPVSVTLREIAEEALAHEAALRVELEEERFFHKGTRADLAGDSQQLLNARAEIAQLKQSLANANSASTALSAELDRANAELERLREELRMEIFRAKCSQEALRDAQEEIATMNASRRAEAEAEDHAAERARLDEAAVDRAVMTAALTALQRRAVALLDRLHAEDEEERMA